MAAIKFLDAATATGESTIKLFNNLINNHTIQADITGAPTAVTVTIEGSLDGVTFDTIGTLAFSAGQLTNTTGVGHAVDTPVNYVRVNLTVLTGGTAPTVTVLYDGDNIGNRNAGRRGQF